MISPRGEHYWGLTSSLLQTAIQAVGKAAAARGIEARHPFFDRRLVEFCLSLPAEQKLARGWTRVILRQAMAGVIPPQVQWRQKKARFSASFNRGLLRFEHPQIQKLLFQESDRLAPYVRLEEVQSSYDCLIRSQGDFTSVESSRSATVIWLLLNLSLWLKQQGMA